jgi:glutamate-1-semialdehyde aminotransferase
MADNRGALADAVAAGPVTELAPEDTYVAFGASRPASATRFGAESSSYVKSVVTRFCSRTVGSKNLAARERICHADWRHSTQPFFHLKETRFPIAVCRSEGAHLWDIDGNEYVDVAMGFGVDFFGHGASFINEAIMSQLGDGMQVGPHSPLCAEVAQLICEFTGSDRAVFCNTGSEAVMLAIRLARAVSGKSRIALFAGAYHGSADPVLVRQSAVAGGAVTVPLAPGIVSGVSDSALVLAYGAPSALEAVRRHAGDLAAVLVEPVQSRQPDYQPVDFLKSLRSLTEEAGVALIFDEVITGFRIHPGGAQAHFGVTADLATYGKVLGGGMPIGVVAGKSQYLDAVDGGAWSFGKAPYPHSIRTFYSGSYCKHPLALAAARAVLGEMRAAGPVLQTRLNARGERLACTLNAFMESAAVPIRIGSFGSLFKFKFLSEPPLSEVIELFYTVLVDKGLYVWEGRTCYLSLAHSEADIEQIVTVVVETVREMQQAGFFPGSRTVNAVR